MQAFVGSEWQAANGSHRYVLVNENETYTANGQSFAYVTVIDIEAQEVRQP